MANVSANTPIFSRGSTVLDYWLAHSEGMIVQPLGARVEEVVVGPPIGRAEALIVRSRMTRRLRAIPVESIAAVEPSAGHLLLDEPASSAGLRISRPSLDRIAGARARAARGMRATRAGAIGAAHGMQGGTRFAFAWLRLRALRAGTTTARYSRSAVTRTAMGVAWLAPRVAATAHTAGTTTARHSRSAATRTAMGVAWLAPRVAATAHTAGTTTARHSRSAAARTAKGVAWLTPRVVAGVRTACVTGGRLTLTAAVIVARGVARAARELENAAAAAAERGRASLEARRARQQRALDD
jgi:hypothetical protein